MRLYPLGAYAMGIHRVQQHAYVHAAMWFAVGLGGAWMVVDDTREARRKAKQARQQQLHKLAALFREVAAREN
jgi:transcription initiation factor TFIID subunit TAF12